MVRTNKPVGSEFELGLFQIFKDKNENYQLSTFGKKTLYLASGRDSLKYIINGLNISENDEILLPAYLCKEILAPFNASKSTVVFYNVQLNLQCDIEDIKKKISRKTKLILIIHYFGFPQQNVSDIKKIINNKKILLVEDCVQSFLSSKDGKLIGVSGDIMFNSYRKFIPIPGGSRLDLQENTHLRTVPVSNNFIYSVIRYLLLLMKGLQIKYPKIIPQFFFYRSFKHADRLLRKQNVQWKKAIAMSSLSKMLLKTFNFKEIKTKRIENYLYLRNNLNNNKIIPLFNHLKPGICPLGFPIICNRRNELRNYLIRNRIYPPIHWKLPKEICSIEFKNSHQLSNSILTIPCDQRYGIKDMERIVTVLNEF